MSNGLEKGRGRYEEAMRLHFQDVEQGICRKCQRTFATPAKLREHYQSDSHRNRKHPKPGVGWRDRSKTGGSK